MSAAAVVAACSSPAQPWAAGAEEYFSAYHAALESGFTNAGPFYAPHVSTDWRGLNGYQAEGRADAVRGLRDLWQNDASEGARDANDYATVTVDEPIYRSVDGAVDPARKRQPERTPASPGGR